MLLALLVFISYSHMDEVAANKLRSNLEGAGCKVWMDTLLRPGQNWSFEIEDAMDRSDVVLTLMSRSSYRSNMVRAEQLRAMRKGKRIVPVLLSKDADIPLPLETLQWITTTEVTKNVRCR